MYLEVSSSSYAGIDMNTYMLDMCIFKLIRVAKPLFNFCNNAIEIQEFDELLQCSLLLLLPWLLLLLFLLLLLLLLIGIFCCYCCCCFCCHCFYAGQERKSEVASLSSLNKKNLDADADADQDAAFSVTNNDFKVACRISPLYF